MNDTVEKFLNDIDFYELPTLMFKASNIDITHDGTKTKSMQYNDIIFWFSSTHLHCSKSGTRYQKAIGDILSFGEGFKAIKYFDALQ
jgi:hypothetical protein